MTHHTNKIVETIFFFFTAGATNAYCLTTVLLFCYRIKTYATICI